MNIDADEIEARRIGERVAARMQSVQMDRAALAKALNVTEDTIYKLLRGETVKRWVDLIRLAQVLQTSPSDLLGFGGTTTRSRLELLLIAAFEGLREKPAQAKNYAQIVLEALDKPPSPGASSESETVRIEVGYEKRQSGGP